MALTLRDVMSPRPGNRRTERFAGVPGAKHLYLAHIGIGFAVGRLPGVNGGDVDRLTHLIDRFHPSRLSDLWSGAGLAAGYTGGVDQDARQLFLKNSAECRREVGQGAVLAIKARVLSDLVTPYTELAAEVFCGRSAEEASELADRATLDLPSGRVPPYEIFRQRVQSYL